MFPQADTLIPVAQVLKSYGTEGQVMISFPEELREILEKNEPVFLFFDSLPVPFFVDVLEQKGNKKAIVRFTDIDTMDQAEEITGMKIHIQDSEAEAADGEFSLEHLIGFTIYDQKRKKVGTLGNVLDFSGNICIEIAESGALIPFHDDLLLAFDPESRSIELEISEGLL